MGKECCGGSLEPTPEREKTKQELVEEIVYLRQELGYKRQEVQKLKESLGLIVEVVGRANRMAI